MWYKHWYWYCELIVCAFLKLSHSANDIYSYTTLGYTNANSSASDASGFTEDYFTVLLDQLDPVHDPKIPVIHLGGLFDYIPSHDGSRKPGSDVLAALLAIQDINKHQILPGFFLKLLFNDSQCDPGRGADAFYHLMYNKPEVALMVGTSCSDVAETLAEITPYWDLMMLSHAATSPALSDREKYPTFYRLTPTDTSHNAMRLAFMEKYKWDTVAILSEDTPMFSLFENALSKSFEGAGINIKATLTFRPSVKGDLKVTLQELQESDARIIVGSFSEEVAARVLCQAYHMGMYGARFVWLLTSAYRSHWWRQPLSRGIDDIECSSDEMEISVNGSFTIGSRADIYPSSPPPQGLSSEVELLRRLPGIVDTSDHHIAMAYDTVWTSALLLNATLSVAKEMDSKMRYRRMTDAMSEMKFTGITGPIRFNGANRQGISVLVQIQDGVPTLVGTLNHQNSSLDTNCSVCQSVIWGGGRVPADKYTKVHLQIMINFTIFMVIATMSCLGIIMASSFLMFNLYNRKLKLIKMSSPKLNNVAVVGCQTVYSAVVLFGVDNSWLGDDHYLPICSLRAWFFAVGFSLAFGSMFAKTFRIHRLFRRAHQGLVKKKLLRDTQLLLLVGALVLLDTIIIVLWVLVEPMSRRMHGFPPKISRDEPDTIYLPELSMCYSPHMMWWGGTLCLYKGGLLVFGVYMAWETRNVQVPALNDSKYIGMNIYNVVLSSVTSVALALLLKDRPSLSYAMVASLILLSTTLLLLFLFMPKIYALTQKKEDLVVTTAGLVTKASTRRFSSPEADRMEEKRRAQIQNRVHKHQLFELNQEIDRLERMLKMSDSMTLADSVMLLAASTFDLQKSPQTRRKGVCYGAHREAPSEVEPSVTFATDDDLDSTDMTTLGDDLSSIDLNDRESKEGRMVETFLLHTGTGSNPPASTHANPASINGRPVIVCLGQVTDL